MDNSAVRVRRCRCRCLSVVGSHSGVQSLKARYPSFSGTQTVRAARVHTPLAALFNADVRRIDSLLEVQSPGRTFWKFVFRHPMSTLNYT